MARNWALTTESIKKSQKPLTNLEPDVFVLYQNHAEVCNAVSWTGPYLYFCLLWSKRNGGWKKTLKL